jgi:hypothetical protein
MAKKCALPALIRLLPGCFGFGGFFHQVFVLVIGGGPEDSAATAAGLPERLRKKYARKAR